MWVTDITYIPTHESWLYLAGIKDLHTREIVGYALGERMTQGLVGRTLFMAISHKRRYATRAQAIDDIAECIEIFYNRQRRHSKLGNLAPAVYAQHYQIQAAA